MPRRPAPTETRILSCTPCRESKVRCVRAEPKSPSCRRCLTQGLTCKSEKSKRRFVKKGDNPPSSSPSAVSPSGSTSHLQDNEGSPLCIPSSSPPQPLPARRKGSRSSASASVSATSLSVATPASATTVSSSDEPGFPSLSNPYKLLAQASGDIEQGTIFSSVGMTWGGSGGKVPCKVARKVVTGDVARWRASFSAGAYTPRMEDREGNDPVACGILSPSRAAALFHTYMDQYNDGNVLLDPELHTFECVSMHSLLSSALYLIVSRQETFDGAAEISDRLDYHIQNKLIPLVVLKGYRTVEIVIGLLALATYHFSTQYIFDDQSWALLGHAIRIGTELDINSRFISRLLLDSDEKVIRHYRSQERTWLNVHLTAQSFALQTGRRPFLCAEGLVEDSENWHLGRYCIRGDVAIVAWIQLRHTYNCHRHLFDRLSSISTRFEKDQRCGGLTEQDLTYFLKRIQEDLKMWYDRFKDADPTSVRGSRFRLYLNQAKVMLFSMPLQNTAGDIEKVKPAITSLYEATIAYLEDLTGNNPFHRLGRGHNSIFINGCYVAVMALKLTTLASRLSWIDVGYLFLLVRKTAERFSGDDRGPRHRKGCSEVYGDYLSWLLNRYQEQSQSLSNDAVELHLSAANSSWTTDAPVSNPLATTEAIQAPFVLPSQCGDGIMESWGDHVAFSDDNFFYSWAQRFLNENPIADSSDPL